ncbi:MAG: hypothetical protein K8T89_07090 [Planctomycetes bacterium]|nr:hypothetical protein [Planctomycetota bacterium]
MKPDLFSFLPEPVENYVTRKIHDWILADSMLSEGCREIAFARKRKRKNRERIVAEELRNFVAKAGRDDEPPGFFRDLLDDGLKEVDWQMLAEFFLDMKAPP